MSPGQAAGWWVEPCTGEKLGTCATTAAAGRSMAMRKQVIPMAKDQEPVDSYLAPKMVCPKNAEFACIKAIFESIPRE